MGRYQIFNNIFFNGGVMKKKTVKILGVFLFLIWGIAGSAVASPMVWTDFVDFQPDVLVPPTLYYTHNISDSGFSSLLMGGDDWIYSYELKVDIYDDNLGSTFNLGCFSLSIPDGGEAATIWTSGGIYSYDFSLTSETYDGWLLGVLDIWADGKMKVAISSWYGDFFVASSTLTAYGDNGAAPVPEPASMLLLGVGLVGLAGFSRKKFKNLIF